MVKETKLNVYQKVLEVKKEIDYLQKDTKGFNYSYVSGTSILAKIREKMNDLGLLLVPVIKSANDVEVLTSQKDKWVNNAKVMVDVKQYMVSGKMTYTWVDVDKPGEIYPVDWMYFGLQDDPSKAFGSALTYSERYFLLKFFNIPTDDIDPDAFQNDKTTTPKPAKAVHPSNDKKKCLDCNNMIAMNFTRCWTCDKKYKENFATQDKSPQVLGSTYTGQGNLSSKKDEYIKTIKDHLPKGNQKIMEIVTKYKGDTRLEEMDESKLKACVDEISKIAPF